MSFREAHFLKKNSYQFQLLLPFRGNNLAKVNEDALYGSIAQL